MQRFAVDRDCEVRAAAGDAQPAFGGEADHVVAPRPANHCAQHRGEEAEPVGLAQDQDAQGAVVDSTMDERWPG